MKDHLPPGARPKLAITEIMCNSALVLEEIDGSSAQLSLVETFSRSLDMVRQAYAAEWSADVDVLLQYAELNLNSAALVRILTENEERSVVRFTEIQMLIIQGSEAAWRLIGDMKTMMSEFLTPERQSAGLTMHICYPRFYFAILFFAAVFIMRTSYMRPTTSREAIVEPLVEVYNLFRLFPHHSDMKIGIEVIQHLVCFANSDESPYLSSPLGGLSTTNRLGASLVWDTIMHLNQFHSERFCKQSVQEIQEPRMPSNGDEAAGSATNVQTDMGHDTSEETNGLQLHDAIDLDWSDMNLPLPVLDIFGLEAGGHITW